MGMDTLVLIQVCVNSGLLLVSIAALRKLFQLELKIETIWEAYTDGKFPNHRKQR